MKIKPSIRKENISIAVTLLNPYIPDLTPVSLVKALENYNGKEELNQSEKILPPYKVSEACQLLQLSKPTIYRMLRDGELSRIKVGNSTRIPAEEIHKLALGY